MIKASELARQAHLACADAQVLVLTGGRWVRVDSVEFSAVDPAIQRPTSVLLKGEEFISRAEVQKLVAESYRMGHRNGAEDAAREKTAEGLDCLQHYGVLRG